MHLHRFPVRQAGLLALCLLVFISFVAAQTLPFAQRGATDWRRQPLQRGGDADADPVFTAPTGAPAAAPTHPGRRDLTRYEKGGQFKVGPGMRGPERDALLNLKRWGFADLFRQLNGEVREYSFWDHAEWSFRKDQGMRIDHIWASPPVADACVACYIDKTPRGWEHPSDHAPVVAEIGM